MNYHLNCTEHDRWKNDQLDTILTDYIDDVDFFTTHTEYFEEYATKIFEKCVAESLLPVYRPEDIKRFEQTNKVYLPIQFKYYLLFISREINGNIFPLFEYDKNVRHCGAMDAVERRQIRLQLIRAHEILQTPDLDCSEFKRIHKRYNRDQYEEFRPCYCDVCDKTIGSGEYYHCHNCATDFDICSTCFAHDGGEASHHQLTRYTRKPPDMLTRDSASFYCWECVQSFAQDQVNVLTFECCSNKHYCCPTCNDLVTSILRTEPNHAKVDDDESDDDDYFKNGCIDFISKGCGEGDYIILTGPHLGKISCWKYRDCNHTNILMRSFFDYLLNKGYDSGHF